MPNTRLGFLYDPAVLSHQPPAGHPERPARVSAVMDLLERERMLERLTRLPVTPATREQLERVHTPAYLDFVEEVVAEGGGYLDSGDTVASPGSWAAATAASGGAVGAVDAVMTGGMDASFALVRPPGHHAPPDRAMGFCILNHAAIAAAHAVSVYGLSRVLLVDFDVHHGNGTQDCFYGSSGSAVFFHAPIARLSLYGGCWQRRVKGQESGTLSTCPCQPDVGEAGFLQAFDQVLRPIAHRFQPEMVLVSAGYDAHWRNAPYVQGIRERLTVRGLAALSRSLQEISDAYCPGRLVGILEGGYDLEALAWGVQATLGVWLGDRETPDPLGPAPGDVREPDITALLNQIRRTHNLDTGQVH